VKSWAVLSEDHTYRYQLGRQWGNGPTVGFVMLNPSTADASQDDPTIRRCIGFAKSWGNEAIIVANLFALRATNPVELRRSRDPIGPDNDYWLLDFAGAVSQIVCAWGRHGMLYNRNLRVMELLCNTGKDILMLAKDGKNYPMHPLYLPSNLQPRPLDT